jgi:hypothetical protein
VAGSSRQVVFASVSARPTHSGGISYAFHGASDARIVQLRQLDLEDLKSLQSELAKAQLHPGEYAQRFQQLLDYVENQFSGLADAVASGDLSPDDFRARAERALRSGYTQAYRYGVGSIEGAVALTDDDVQNILDAFQQDNAYLATFAQQIADGYVPVNPEDRPDVQGQMLLSDRANMYANSTRELYYRGQVSRIDDGDEIEWQDNGDKDECAPCLEAAAGSPYSKDSLPGYPGDLCDGGSRCRCDLVYASQVAAQPAESTA